MSRSVPSLLAVLVIVSACGSGDRRQGGGELGVGDVPAERLGFTRYADAVQWASVSDWIPPGDGLRLLVPLGDCALGLGTYRNGHRTVGVNWTGDATCTRLNLDPAPGPDSAQGSPDLPPGTGGGWPGAGLSGNAALALENGSVLAVDDAGLTRRDPDGTVQQLARLDLPDEGVPGEGGDTGHALAIARTDARLVVGGGQTVAGRSIPLMWTSTDGGRTLHPVALPVERGAPGSYVTVLAAAGDQVIAAGGATGSGSPANRVLQVWSSPDGGLGWHHSLVPDLPADATVHTLLKSAGRWILAGGIDEPRGPDRPFLLTSSDGMRWELGGDTKLGPGRVVASTVDQTGQAVLLGQLDQVDQGGSDRRSRQPDDRPRYCGVVWVADGADGWQRGELGCGDAPPTAVTTLTDGRVLIAGNRDLWLSR